MHNLVCLKLIETVESDLLDDTLFLYSLHLTMLPVWRRIHDDELIGLKNVILDLATFMSIYPNWIIKSLLKKTVNPELMYWKTIWILLEQTPYQYELDDEEDKTF